MKSSALLEAMTYCRRVGWKTDVPYVAVSAMLKRHSLSGLFADAKTVITVLQASK